MILLKMWKKTFNRENFGLRHPFPYHFAMSIFQKKPRITVSWLVYRGIMAFYFTVTLMYSCSCIDDEWFKHFIYLTYWTYILETLMFNLGFIVALKLFKQQKNRTLEYIDIEDVESKYSRTTPGNKSIPRDSKSGGRMSKVDTVSVRTEGENDKKIEPSVHEPSVVTLRFEKPLPTKKERFLRLFKRRKSSGSVQSYWDTEATTKKKLPCYIRFFWVLYNLVLPVAIGITFIFWILLYDPETFPSLAKNIILHCFNSVFMIVDFIIVAHPVKILHFYMPSIYGVVYALFSYIYQSSGGTGSSGSIPIYKILDWRYPVKTVITVVLCLLFVTIIHIVLAFLDLIKIPIRYRKREILDVV